MIWQWVIPFVAGEAVGILIAAAVSGKLDDYLERRRRREKRFENRVSDDSDAGGDRVNDPDWADHR